MTGRSLRLADRGARVAVIGGGPAGAFSAHFLLKEARARGVDLEVTIFDAKHFLATGPAGCNLCAGVISETLIDHLRAEGIVLPDSRIQRRIGGYTIHAPGRTVRIAQPDGEKRISVVFRGNGPLCSLPDAPVSFDDFLLEHVVAEGAVLAREHVLDLTPSVRGGPVLIRTSKRSEEFDLVVVACGINSGLIRSLASAGIGYRPPGSLVTIQAELPLEEEWMERYGDDIHVFTPTAGEQRFVAVIPKTRYLTVSIIPRRNARMEDLHRFLETSSLRTLLPRGWRPPARFCTCRPRIPIGSPRGGVADRLVVVGDAAWSRSYKNGIFSAFLSARRAAAAIFDGGVDRRSLERSYVATMKKVVAADNRYGISLFLVYDLMRRYEFMAASFVEVLTERSAAGDRLRRITWDLMTGNRSYRAICGDFISPSLQAGFIRSTLTHFGGRLRGLSRLAVGRKGELGPLKSGARVAIIGGGPAGAAAAIALIDGAAARGIEVAVTIYEGKRFDGQGNYNACVGVLSPPIRGLLEELGVPFPSDLVLRVIDRYVLHGRHESVELPGETTPAYAVRRITFDRFLLEEAVKRGAEVRNSRVVGLEIEADRALIYSDTDSRAVDLVIGAFGLDDGASALFAEATGYRPPAASQSILAKFHPGLAAVDQYGSTIQAYLPGLRGVDFGAITPKRDHLVVNIAGPAVTARDLDAFLDLPSVRAVLPATIDELRPAITFFKGKFPTSPAVSYYGDRYVMVGDACGLVRPFKGKGVNAALSTAMRAAEVALEHGISTAAFRRYERCFQDVLADRSLGVWLRRGIDWVSRSGRLDRILAAAKHDESIRKMLFDCVSGHRTYRAIGKEFGFGGLWRLLRSMAGL